MLQYLLLYLFVVLVVFFFLHLFLHSYSGKQINISENFIFLYFGYRRRISIAYFKLPCIHSSSATKDSRDNTPLSHSPIHGKHKKGLNSVYTGLVRCRVIVNI
jgi:hypothetical protein